MNFVAIDFETANYRPDSACSVGLVKVVGGVIVDKQVYLIRPPTRDFVFTYIHGLSWKDVSKKDDFGTIWSRVESILDGAEFLVAHNASFDRRVLEACCATYQIPAPSLPFQCTVQVARRTWGIYPTKLSNVCEKLGMELNHHEALSDALACAKIMIAATKGTAAETGPLEKKTDRRDGQNNSTDESSWSHLTPRTKFL
jgi:DNA polymerase III subunit epsilon